MIVEFVLMMFWADSGEQIADFDGGKWSSGLPQPDVEKLEKLLPEDDFGASDGVGLLENCINSWKNIWAS